MIRLESARCFEERLGRHCKEFGRVLRAVDVDDPVVVIWYALAQPIELRRHYASPRLVLGPCIEIRRAVGASVLEVELMRKFMEHDIGSIARIHRTMLRCIPCQNQCAKIVCCVSEPVFRALFPQPAADVS